MSNGATVLLLLLLLPRTPQRLLLALLTAEKRGRNATRAPAAAA
jgi:hypothetical protein